MWIAAWVNWEWTIAASLLLFCSCCWCIVVQYCYECTVMWYCRHLVRCCILRLPLLVDFVLKQIRTGIFSCDSKDNVTTSVENLECWREFDSCRGNLRKWPTVGKCQGNNLVRENCLLINSYLGLCQYLVAACMYIWHGNCSLDKNAVESNWISQCLHSGQHVKMMRIL